LARLRADHRAGRLIAAPISFVSALAAVIELSGFLR
jgi:hypothetical protein